jgi:hypothetical protein
MSDGMSELYRRKYAIERFKLALGDLYQEAPNDWIEIVMKSVASKYIKKVKVKKSKKVK